MKAKVREGHSLLFSQGCSNDWRNLKDEMIINFIDRWTYKSFEQIGNHLLIYTRMGNVDIVFTGEVPKVTFQQYEKEQLILRLTNL